MRGWLGGVVAVGFAVCANGAVTTLPFSDGFETNALGGPPSSTYWATTGEGTVQVVTSPTPPEGTNSCLVSGDTLKINSDYATRSNLWVKLFCKPTAYDDSAGQPTASDCSAAFYVNTNGVLYAYADTNGAGLNGWTDIKSGLNTNSWHGFMVHLDYSNRLWDIYHVSGSSTSAPMVIVNTVPLRMPTSHSNRLWQAAISSGGSTYVDAFSIVNGRVALSQSTASPTSVHAVAEYTMPRGAAAREFLLACISPGGVGLANSEFGDNLLAALDNLDKVHILFPATGWNVYKKAAGVWTKFSGGGPDPNGVVITRTMGFWIESVAGGNMNITAGVALYNNSTPVNPTVDDTENDRWTYLTWPYEDRQVNDPVKGLGFTTLNGTVAGDLLFLYRASDGGYTRLWWSAANGWWMKGGGKATADQILKGQGFFYRRNSGSPEFEWKVNTVQ
jgi:hypothetical protein